MTWGEWRGNELLQPGIYRYSTEHPLQWETMTAARANALEACAEAAKEVAATTCQRAATYDWCLDHHSRWPCDVEELRQALAALEGAADA